MIGYTDVHHHLLYGLDDGPSTKEQMYAMLKRAANEGVSCIVATPHVVPGIEKFDEMQYCRALDEANAFCTAKGLNLRVLSGAEVFYTDMTLAYLQQEKIHMISRRKHVLVEFPTDVKYLYLRDSLNELRRRGYRPVLAHMERYGCLTSWPPLAIRLRKETGALYQVNCSSVLGRGRFIRKIFVRWLLKHRMVDLVASDAHNTTSRPCRMNAACRLLKEKYGSDYARKLCTASAIFGER